MLKAVLFDLDDTLIDWSGFNSTWENRDRELLQGVVDYVNDEIQFFDDFELLVVEFRKNMGAAWEDGRASLRAPHLGQVMVEALVAVGVPEAAIDERRCLEAYNWGAAPGVVTFPEVPEVLELLLANGVRIGIVTNAHQPMWVRDRELAQLGLLDYFSKCRLSAADVGYLKPHPTIFERALACIGTEPAETVFVGDNPVADIAGAQGAGLQAVLRLRQPSSPMLSGLIVPDHAIHSMHELPAILDQWYPGWRT
jgi:FMN phosphatase YigB (HAD superfamily)